VTSRDGRLRVKFGDVVRQVKETADPDTSGLERYVAGEHMGTDELQITSWGSIGDGYLGPAFHRRFHSRQVLYGSRRTYLRKVAFADFDGICANTTFVCETADQDILLPELLPFIMQTDGFHAHSIAQSKGSVNPYINWTDLAWFEFDLPPIDEQGEIADLLWASESLLRAYKRVFATHECASRAAIQALLASGPGEAVMLGQLVDPRRPLCYGVVQPGVDDKHGVPLIRVCDIEGDELVLGNLRRIGPSVHSEYKRSVVEAGDVLVSVVGTIGRTFLVPEQASGFNIARAIARIAPDPTKVVPELLATILRTPDLQRSLFNAAFESVRRTLNLNSLAKIEVKIPPSSTQDAILSVARHFELSAAALLNQRRRLQALRRALLQEDLAT
jgi:type I restriction enzyme S subunit